MMLLHYLIDLEFKTLGIILFFIRNIERDPNMCATVDIKDITKRYRKKGFYFIYDVYLIYI